MKKPHVTEACRLRAERLLELLRKRGPKRPIANAIALEIADLRETVIACAMIAIERELAAALTNPTLDVLSPFSEVVMATDRRAVHIARNHSAARCSKCGGEPPAATLITVNDGPDAFHFECEVTPFCDERIAERSRRGTHPVKTKRRTKRTPKHG